MPSHRIAAEFPLSKPEREALDAFAGEHAGVEGLAALAGFLGERFGLGLTLDPEIVEGYATDSSNLPGRAAALCRPADERGLAVCLRACRGAGLPVTVSAGRSNLTGSATPPGGVLLSTANLCEPLAEVDVAARTVRCAAAAPFEEMRRAVAQKSVGSLWFPVDPTSREEALVGGAAACNASGFTPGEKGAMRPWVCAVRFVLPDGSAIAAERGRYVSQDGVFLVESDEGRLEWPVPRYVRPAIKNASGPWSAPEGGMDLVDLLVGSEGIFGVVTECVLALGDAPGECLDLFFSLPGEEDALRFLLRSLDRFDGDLGALRAFEYFGVHCRKYMDHEGRFFRGHDQVAVYVREPLEGREVEDVAQAWLETLAEAECDPDEESILLIDTPQLQTLFMEARHSMPAKALEVVQERGAYTIMTDAVVPPAHFGEFLTFCHRRLEADGLDYLSFGHLGDCHLHFTILPEAEAVDRAVAAYDAIIAESARLGGVYSGEHGTGKRKRRDFEQCYGPQAIEDVRRCKAAVDPHFLLNPGNVVEPPTA